MNLPLKIAFMKKGISQIEASHTLGLDPSRLSKLINGWVKPKTEERKILADYLGQLEKELFSVEAVLTTDSLPEVE